MQQTGELFYRFRFLWAGVVALAILVTTSTLVTALASDSVFAKDMSTSTTASSATNDPNAVAAGASQLSESANRLLLSIGTGMYRGCKAVNDATVQTGKTLAEGGSEVIGGVGHGVSVAATSTGHVVAAVGRGIGNGFMATVRAPGKLAKAAAPAPANAFNALVRPADQVAEKIPIIDGETSAEAAARLDAEQQQQFTAWLADQLAANQALDGAVVAGDLNHGGYPAIWDNARQDSKLDNWGMYNRECVSYAAWKVFQTYGTMPYWGGVGNANEWVQDAKNAGIPTGSIPQVHSVAISMRGHYGHAMWVEAVKDDMIYVSQYNYDLHGHYSEMWVNSSSFTYIYFK